MKRGKFFSTPYTACDYSSRQGGREARSGSNTGTPRKIILSAGGPSADRISNTAANYSSSDGKRTESSPHLSNLLLAEQGGRMPFGKRGRGHTARHGEGVGRITHTGSSSRRQNSFLARTGQKRTFPRRQTESPPWRGRMLEGRCLAKSCKFF